MQRFSSSGSVSFQARRLPLKLLLKGLIAGMVIACGVKVAQGEKGLIDKDSGGKPSEVTGVLRVIGNGAPDLRSPSVHVAQQDAGRAAEAGVLADFRQLVEAMRLPEGGAVGKKLAQDEALSKRLEKVLSSYRVIDRRYYSDGSMDIIAELSLYDVIAAIEGTGGKKASALGKPTAEVIVDARSVKKYRPSLYPRLLGADGRVLLESKPKEGLISFATSIDAARSIASRDATVLRLDEDALSGGDLVIPDAEAESLARAGAARVVIVPPRVRE